MLWQHYLPDSQFVAGGNDDDFDGEDGSKVVGKCDKCSVQGPGKCHHKTIKFNVEGHSHCTGCLACD